MTHDTDTRTQLRRYVADNPGIHFNRIVKETDLASGQVQYHARRLLSSDRLVRETVSGRTHYYPPEYDEWERGAIALLRRETPRDVIAHLLEEGPTDPGTVADDLDIARSTLEHHLDALQAHGVVRKDRDDRGRVTLLLPRPEATLRLLEELTPSLPASMVDRFTRLVDRLLE